jgi:iron complex transport system substrate-binding protein
MVKLKLVAASLVAAVVTAGGLGLQAVRAEPVGKLAAAPAFPVTLKAANGYVTITKRPLRIVSLSPTATESLFAIGAGAQVVAVDDQSNYPAGVPRTKLSGFRPNAEAVAAYEPDLVIASSAANNLLPALEKLKIPVLHEPAAKTIGDAYVQIRQLGWATGHNAAAGSVVQRMKNGIAAIVRSTPTGKPLRVYHELTPDYYSATSSTFIGRVYALFGLRNIADAAATTGSGYPQLSGEYVIASSPDLIVLADTKCCAQSAKTVRERTGWSSIAAVRKGNVVLAGDDIPSRWGPRIVDFTRLVARAITRART